MCDLSYRAFFVLLFGLMLGLLIGLAIPRSADVDFASQVTSASFDENRLVSILATPDRLQREKRLLALFESLPPEELERVWASFGQLRPNLDASAILALMDWWAGFDPESAFETSGSFGDLGTLARATVVRRWAQRDPTSARDALAAHKGRRSPQLLLALVRGWGESGQPGAWRYVEQMPMGALRQQAIGTLVDQLLLREGPDAVTAFVERLPDLGRDRFKLQAFRQAAAALAMRHPERATAWVERHYEGPFGDGLLFKAALSWVLLDGESAVAWLADLPADDAQQYAMRAAYGFWLQQDRARAHTWLQESGEMSRVLEPAWVLLVFDIGSDDPRAGLDLLSTIVMGDALRESTTIGLVSAWMQRNPGDAQSWLAAARLPEHVVEEIEEARPPTRRRAAKPAKLGQAGTPADVAR
jgi:hypothetical protein